MGKRQLTAALHWQVLARDVLKGEMKRTGVSYTELANRLTEMGLDENYRALINKVNRGTFSAAFLLACMSALGNNSFDL